MRALVSAVAQGKTGNLDTALCGVAIFGKAMGFRNLINTIPNGMGDEIIHLCKRSKFGFFSSIRFYHTINNLLMCMSKYSMRCIAHGTFYDRASLKALGVKYLLSRRRGG